MIKKKKARKLMELTPAENRNLTSRLGKEKDIVLAAEFNVTRQAISAKRKARGIAVCQPPERMPYCVPVHFTKADERGMKRALKAVGETNRSEYIRLAVRARNKEVLENGS